MRVSEHFLKFNEEIKNWDEAVPIGGGNLGCLIYGKQPLRLHLDRIDLWDEREAPETKESGFCYENLMRLVRSGEKEDFAEHNRLFDAVYSHITPTKITAGALELFWDDVRDISYGLDIKNARASVKHSAADLQVYCSAEYGCGVMRIRGEMPKIKISMPKYLSDANGLKYPAAKYARSDDFSYCIQKTFSPLQYGIFVSVFRDSQGGWIFFSLEASDGKLKPETIKENFQKLFAAKEKIAQKHAAHWRRFWKESEIRIPDAVLEKQYYLSNYFFESCSANNKFPIPLQGLWTADNDALPPWKGDYHHDLNTQLTYSHCFQANHLRSGKIFINYLWKHRKDFKKFTKEFYKVNGLLIPAVSSINGKPLGGWPQYSFSPTMTIWCIRSFEEYYALTQDCAFLKNRAYPMFYETEKAIFSLLKEKDGKFHLPLSTSPEIFNNSPQSYLIPESNNDLALLKYLYRTLIDFCRILGIDNEYDKILGKLDDYHGDGELWLDRKIKPFFSHRHHSHLMGIYPLKDPVFFHGEGLSVFDNSMKRLEELGVKEWVGFSFTWAAALEVMRGNAEKFGEYLHNFCSTLLSPNGFHLNGDYRKTGLTNFDYRPFTLESNFHFCAALQYSLAYYADGIYYLFRGVKNPEENGEWQFKNFRMEGGMLFSAKYSGGVCRLKVKSRCDAKITAEVFGKKFFLSVKSGISEFYLKVVI